MTDSLSALLKKYNLQPRKGLGQNFLSDPFHLDKIVEAAQLSLADTVLEIGPGPGTLTRLLIESAGRVIAVELDPGMVNLLQNEFGHYPNLTIVHADILKTDVNALLEEFSSEQSAVSSEQSAVSSQQLAVSSEQLAVSSEQLAMSSQQLAVSSEQSDVSDESAAVTSKTELTNSPNSPNSINPTNSINSINSINSTKVVANLPYYITSAVMRHLLETTPPPEQLVVTVQKEVAQRIVAKPGNMSVLAVSVQFYGHPTLMHRIPAGAFYPPPKIDSAVVRVDTYPQHPIPVADVDYFFRVVKAGFSQKRKQLKNSLAGGLQRPMPEVVAALEQAGIAPTRRAQTLNLKEWGRLTAALR